MPEFSVRSGSDQRPKIQRPGAVGSVGNVSDLLGRLWAQAENLMADLENCPLPPKEQASVLAILARIMPQLVAAAKQWQMHINGRDIATLTDAQLADLLKANASRPGR